MKRKVSALIMATLLTALYIIQPMVYADMNNLIYDLSFENGTDGFENVTEHGISRSGMQGLLFESTEKADAPSFRMTFLERSSKSNISVWVKPKGATNVTFKLSVDLNERGTNRSYVLDTVKTVGDAWVELNGNLFLKYRNAFDAPVIRIEAECENQDFKGFYIDDFKVVADKASLNSFIPVPEFNEDGNFKMRFSFETGTIEKFLTEGVAAYTFVSPEYEMTNEVSPHSGRYCLKVSNRSEHSQVLTLEFPNLPKDAKIKVACWVRNANGIEKQRYILQGVIPTSTGKKWPWLSDYITVQKDEWVRIEGLLDTTGYTMTDIPQIRFTTTNESFVDYYIDDITIEGNFKGEFYDDMNYKPREYDEEISDTPNVISPSVMPIQEDIPSLKDVYKEYFKFGAAVTQDAVKPGRYMSLISKHCNTIVGENSFKMNTIIRDPKDKTKYNFAHADALMDFASKNGIEEVVGHCLVWDVSVFTPYLQDENNKWIDRDTNLKFMQEYIDRVIKHFEGDGDPSEYAAGVDYSNWHLASWDVCNEAASHETQDGYKRSGGSWINGIGKDYVDYAYEYATKTVKENGYDIEFRYNDYGEEMPAKRDAVYNLVKGLLDRNVNIQKLGIQSHYKTNTSSTTIRRAIEKYASLGLPMDITELDIGAYTATEISQKSHRYVDGVTKEAEFTQATLYNELFELYKEYADSIDRVVTWTICDRLAYLNYTKYIKKEYAGIFDRNYQAKPQFWSIVDPNKYFKEIMNEDTSKVRVTFDAKSVEFKDEESCIEQNGIIYVDAIEILEVLGVKYVYKNGKISIIRNGKFVEIAIGSDNINSDFKVKKLSAPAIEHSNRVYIPITEVCNELDFGTSYNEMRNMINISSDQMGETLI